MLRKLCAFCLALNMIVCLCSCGKTKQYGILRLSNADSQAEDFLSDSQSEVRNAFYTDQTISMGGFCGKEGYITTLNEVRSLLANEVYDIYRYDVMVDKIGVDDFIQNYHNNKLNFTYYYSYNASEKGKKTKKTVEGIGFKKKAEKDRLDKKGRVMPLKMALAHAFGTDENIDFGKYAGKYSGKYNEGLCVFTTDCYEQNRNYPVLFAPLADRVFSRGNAVAFMGVQSDFKGEVKCVTADNKGGYSYDKPRWFYIIVAGPVGKVVDFSSTLSDHLNKKEIKNEYSILLPPDKARTIIEDSVALEPVDEDASSLPEVADGKSFLIKDFSDHVIMEDSQNYYPTFSAKVLTKMDKHTKMYKAVVSTFSVEMDITEGIDLPQIYVKPEYMSYEGLMENDNHDENSDSRKETSETAIIVSGEPDQVIESQGANARTKSGNDGLNNLIVHNLDSKTKDSITVEHSINKNRKLQIKTIFNDPSVIKENGIILVKYSIYVDEINDIPSWVLEMSAPNTSKENRGKTLDLEFLYDGLRKTCNKSMKKSELFTFYCYYTND